MESELHRLAEAEEFRVELLKPSTEAQPAGQQP
jgi:hypothetical protein